MKHSEAFISQFKASLAMLKQTIQECPEGLWNDPEDKTRIWRIAYHSLFFTHLYLADSSDSFKPWSKHRQDYESLDLLTTIGEPYDKEEVLEYLDYCQDYAESQIPKLDLEAESGFFWLPFKKLELLIYNLRHLQQHTGELMERLGTRAGKEIHWVSHVTASQLANNS